MTAPAASGWFAVAVRMHWSARETLVTTDSDAILVRVEKGHASDEELAAITVLLLARLMAPAGGPARRWCAAPRVASPHHCAHCPEGVYASWAPRSWQAVLVSP